MQFDGSSSSRSCSSNDTKFKVAGTRAGITALQMDIKVPNVTTSLMKDAQT
jgi:polyribonucleotide nucleotidyltransferase